MFGQQIHNGGKSLFIKMSISATSNKLIDVLMLMETKTKRVNQSRSIIDTTVLTKDSRFSILTKRKRSRPRD